MRIGRTECWVAYVPNHMNNYFLLRYLACEKCLIILFKLGISKLFSIIGMQRNITSIFGKA